MIFLSHSRRILQKTTFSSSLVTPFCTPKTISIPSSHYAARSLTSHFPPPHNNSHPSPHSLAGKTALITGASRGIGRATALLFATHGARTLLIGRDSSALTSTLHACEAASGRTAFHAMQIGDVSEREFWTGLDLKGLLPNLGDWDGDAGSVDVLVNAAGVTHSSPLLATSEALVRRVLDTNLMGVLWASQVLGKKMLRQKGGVVVNVASLLASHGGAGSAAYVASKSGVVGLTRALAGELGAKGIRVNTVLPGYVSSDMTDGEF